MHRVVAIRDGYYGGIVRRIGDVFHVANESELSKRWMAKEGTEKFADFVSAHNATGPDDSRDRITGERIRSGGVAEQLAVALEENRRMSAQIVELEAELAIYKQDAKPSKVESRTPAEPEDKAEAEAAKPVRRRRSTKG